VLGDRNGYTLAALLPRQPDAGDDAGVQGQAADSVPISHGAYQQQQLHAATAVRSPNNINNSNKRPWNQPELTFTLQKKTSVAASTITSAFYRNKKA
jgi:hypothetical protein